ncbi:MAG: GIY-YIG nuclease family protein [Leptospiraceae bacterium]|nr:GIY-YIG nuclease family protein [Leptospiraceae bacterium]
MHKYFVYILECNDKSFYIGVTNNIEERLGQHQEGLDNHCYTFSRRPVSLLYSEEFSYINDAIAREKQLKGWSRKKKLALISGDYDKLRDLSKNYGNPSTGSG